MKSKKIKNCKYDLKFDYYVTDEGEIWSSKSKKFLSKQLDKNGYEKVQMISTDGKRHRYSVHRLVLENHDPVPNMINLQVNHKDGNKRNNKLTNLEWCTPKENVHHAIKNGLRTRINGEAKLTPEKVLEICFLLKEKKITQKEIAKQYEVSVSAIERIKAKKLWKSITQDFDFS